MSNKNKFSKFKDVFEQSKSAFEDSKKFSQASKDELKNIEDNDDDDNIKHLHLKDLLKFAIIMVLTYALSDKIVSLIYKLVVRGHIVYNLPYINAIKFFAVGCVFIYVIYKFLNFTYEGRKIFPYLAFIAISGLAISISSFNYVDDNKLVEYRMFIPFEHSWDEVEYVDAQIYKKSVKSRKNMNRTKPKTHIKYLFVFENGKKMNAWSNVSDNLILHEKVLDRNVSIEYNKRDLKQFIIQYETYFKEDMESIVHIFYGKKYKSVD